jgi:hypothetical protein
VPALVAAPDVRLHARDASRFATAAEDVRNEVGDGIESSVHGLRCVQLLRQRLVVSAVFVAPAVRKSAGDASRLAIATEDVKEKAGGDIVWIVYGLLFTFI